MRGSEIYKQETKRAKNPKTSFGEWDSKERHIEFDGRKSLINQSLHRYCSIKT